MDKNKRQRDKLSKSGIHFFPFQSFLRKDKANPRPRPNNIYNKKVFLTTIQNSKKRKESQKRKESCCYIPTALRTFLYCRLHTIKNSPIKKRNINKSSPVQFSSVQFSPVQVPVPPILKRKTDIV